VKNLKYHYTVVLCGGNTLFMNTKTRGSHKSPGIVKHTSNHGFSLIELMLVVVIIGILTALVAPRLIHRADEARVTAAKIQIKNYETALKRFKFDNAFYPTTDQGLAALVTAPETGIIPENYRPGGYLEKKHIEPDPWGNGYLYISPGTQGDYDIISYGADGLPGGKEYNADITNWD
jgi:general secretion pathway protein G